jgi:hypothetical protein
VLEKKNMLKTNQVLLAVASLLAIGLSGCGKENYQGTYTGYDVASASTTAPTGTTGYNPNTPPVNQAPRTVTLTLSNNGDLVSGTYTAAATNQFNGGYSTYNSGFSTGATYTFSASSSTSGQLTNVTMIPSASTGGSSYSSCALQGSLSSSDKGQSITGTLSPFGYANSGCTAITINLTRPN